MNRIHRLEDLLAEWRQECAGRIREASTAIAGESTADLPARVDLSNPTCRLAIRGAVTERVTEFAATRLLPESLEWLAGQGVAMPASDRTRSDVDLAVRQWSPAFDPFLPGPDARVPYTSLALTAAGGGVLGCLALTPLGLLLLGQREPGLLVGGILGSGLAVGLVSWLSQRPKVLDALHRVVGAASVLTALGGIVQVFRRQSLGLLKSAGWIGGCWLVLLIARPRLTGPSREQCREALGPQVEQLLTRAVDLVLMLCWSHPDRAGQPPPSRQADRPTVLPTSLADALGVLQAASADQDAPIRHLQGAVRSVLQRVGDLGYEWQTVPAGTPYDAALEERFDCFDQVTVGQRVETLEPALVCRGELVKQGMLRSLNA